MHSERDPFGLFYTWWRADPLPELAPVAGLAIEQLTHEQTLEVDIDLDLAERLARLEQGHILYCARVDGQVAGWGWSATERADIGELGIHMTMPPANRYLWDFVTRPDWRGKGIYGHLIQAMLRQQPDVERFWIGHDYGNTASGKGILKTGFQLVGKLYPAESGFYLAALDNPERTVIAAALLDVPTEASECR